MTPRALRAALLTRQAAVDAARTEVAAAAAALADARGALADATARVEAARASQATHHAPAEVASPERLLLWRSASQHLVAAAAHEHSRLADSLAAAEHRAAEAQATLRERQAALRAIEVATERRHSAEQRSAIRREHDA